MTCCHGVILWFIFIFSISSDTVDLLQDDSFMWSCPAVDLNLVFLLTTIKGMVFGPVLLRFNCSKAAFSAAVVLAYFDTDACTHV